jgi:hypothetical protein
LQIFVAALSTSRETGSSSGSRPAWCICTAPTASSSRCRVHTAYCTAARALQNTEAVHAPMRRLGGP